MQEIWWMRFGRQVFKMIKNLYLIRHGQSMQNKVANCFSGSTDVSISEKGRQQAAELAGFFRDITIDEIYTSKLVRAIQTAKIIFGEDRPLIQVEALREADFGEYEGRAFEKGDTDPVYQAWLHAADTLTFPGGDNMCERMEEYYAAVKRLMSETVAEKVAIVSHRTSIRLFTAKVMGLPIQNFRNIPCDNCSVMKFRFDEETGEFALEYCNYRQGVR